MNRKIKILTCLMMVILAGGLTSCMNQGQQAQQTVEQKAPEGPPPDYTSIRAALKDPSEVVRIQALKNLGEIKHSSAIEQFVDISGSMTIDRQMKRYIVSGLVKFKDQAIEPVTESLWNDKDPVKQDLGLSVLMQIDEKETLLPKVVERFFATPSTPENSELRIAMVKYFSENLNPEEGQHLSDLILMLNDPDSRVAQVAFKAVKNLKSPLLIEKMTQLYMDNKENMKVLEFTTTALSGFSAIDPKNNPVPVSDITLFLYGFGSYNKKIQGASYQGLKKFAYDDADGQIMSYLKSFESCDYDLVRSHIVDLMISIPKTKYPEGQEPKFELPAGFNRTGFCH